MSATLRAEFKSALDEAQKIRDAAERSEEEIQRFKQLTDEVLPGLEAKIKAHDAVSQTSLDRFSELTIKGFSTPYASGRNVGQATITEDGDVFDEGEGLVTDKLFKAVSSPEYTRAFKTYMRLGETRVKERYPSVFKTLSAGLDDYSSIMIPPDILDKMIGRLPAPTTIAGRVTRYSTASNRLMMLRETYRDPSGLDIRTSPIQGQWTGEGGDPEPSPEPGFGEVSIPIHEYMGRLSISNTLLEDAGFNLEGFISGKLQQWLDYHYEYHLLFGSGVGQPQGIWTIAGRPQGVGQPGFVESAAAGTIDADTLKGMRYEILPQYQSDAVFIMNQRSAKVISLLKDKIDGYLLQKGSLPKNTINDYSPLEIDGTPVILSNYLPDIASGKCFAGYGSLKGYYMVNRLGMTVRVLNEIEAVKNRRVYLFRLRWGGMQVEDQYWKYIKIK